MVAEGSFIACGIGYNGKVKNARTGKEEVPTSAAFPQRTHAVS